MPRRAVLAVSLLALLASACIGSTTGPTRPAAPDRVAPDDAVKATGARAAAAAFVRAYARDTGADVADLRRLVGTSRLRSWAHWLGVQNDAFPGTITGTVVGDEIGPAAPFSVPGVPGSESILRQVDVRATVTFRLEPAKGAPFSVTRSLDGPMRLVQDPSDGGWRVLDFTRDGIPLSRVFEVVENGTAAADGIRLTIDAFVSAPYWEFLVSVSGDRPFGLTPKGTELTGSDGARVASARALTASLGRVRAGRRVEGIATFSPQPSAEGLTLSVRVVATGGAVSLEIPLSNLIQPIPLTTSPTPSPGG